MINNKRISKLKRDIYKKFGKAGYSKFIIQAKDGLYLFEMDKRAIYYKNNYTRLDEAIGQLEIIDCMEYGINNLLIVCDGKASPVIIPDDIPYSRRIAEGYLNNPKEPFKNFTNEELKEILAE